MRIGSIRVGDLLDAIPPRRKRVRIKAEWGDRPARILVEGQSIAGIVGDIGAVEFDRAMLLRELRLLDRSVFVEIKAPPEYAEVEIICTLRCPRIVSSKGGSTC